VLRFEHFQVTPDYVADVSKHPYTSGIGVAPEGAGIVRETCKVSSGKTIRLSPAPGIDRLAISRSTALRDPDTPPVSAKPFALRRFK